MVYVDTSALLKRYLNEALSDEFDAFFAERTPCAISRLSFVEVRCAVARRRRNQQIAAETEVQTLEQLRIDIQDGAIVVHPVADNQFAQAYHLIDQLQDIPLRTLDALHLSIAKHTAARGFATADRNQAAAASAIGLTVYPFYSA
ncbi:MAG TPA: type II toxin-antitoxin system VapC family toxin [Rhodocyclaceae bacterium]|nr:type II toxin-antitoxin system VapC family toxin [Rhodocyclaceae bacterium]